MSAGGDPGRVSRRDELLAELGAPPPWWRLFRRRAWWRRRAEILAMDVSMLAGLLARIYSPEDLERQARRRQLLFSAMRRATP